MQNLLAFIFGILICCTLNFSLHAQESDTRFHILDYMKVHPGMGGDYLKLETAWKKIHERNIAAGKQISWVLDRVLSPSGSSTEYNYVTRNTFDNAADLANYLTNGPNMPDDLEAFFSDDELKLVMKTGEIRSLVKEEIWTTVDGVFAEDMSDAKIHVFNFFDHPKGKTQSDHFKMENDIWKPVHTARVADGKMRGWALVSMMSPSGSSMPYHEATVDVYTNLEQMMEPFVEKYFNKVHEDKDMSKLFEETSANSDLIKRDIRMEIDRAE